MRSGDTEERRGRRGGNWRNWRCVVGSVKKRLFYDEEYISMSSVYLTSPRVAFIFLSLGTALLMGCHDRPLHEFTMTIVPLDAGQTGDLGGTGAVIGSAGRSGT